MQAPHVQKRGTTTGRHTLGTKQSLKPLALWLAALCNTPETGCCHFLGDAGASSCTEQKLGALLRFLTVVNANVRSNERR